MIDKKYVELIHKEIDKTISKHEKELLEAQLNTNPEAQVFHKDLLKTEALLDEIPDKNPSESLRQRILNSIDYSRYSKTERKASIIDSFASLFTGPKRKLTTSFAFGLVTGIIIFSVIFFASNYSNVSQPKNIVGTMGLYESETFESVDINTMGISGVIDISKVSNHYGINVNLKSSEKYTLEIEFNPSDSRIEDLSFSDLDNVIIEKKPGTIKVIGTDTPPYTLIFAAKELTPQKVLLKILQDENKLFEQEISLSIN